VLRSGSVDAFRIEVHMVDGGCCCHFDRSPLAQFFSASLQKYCDAALALRARRAAARSPACILSLIRIRDC
jgi:hypothetical protein